MAVERTSIYLNGVCKWKKEPGAEPVTVRGLGEVMAYVLEECEY